MNKMDENVIKLVSEDLSAVKNLILSSLNSEIVSFDKAMNFYLQAPSKLLRPIMCLIFQKALYGEVNDKILYVASAVELAHNASLLHDDVIDEALIRRNTNSFNEKFGSKSAILAGDWLVSQVMSFLNKVGNNKLYELFAEAIKKMAEGELFQLFSKGTIPSLSDYYFKNQNKTGQLFKIAVSAPAVLANDCSSLEKLEKFAFHFSNAFQISDDIDDYFSLNEDKPSNLDTKQEIYTLPYIIKKNGNVANLYEECCKNLNHQVNLSIESLDFMRECVYKEAVVSLCHSLLRDKDIEF